MTPGSRLGPYEITGAIGAGGMGEVFRARDTKLGRDVAIKVLPAEFAKDHERVARFRREAQILASLNHPNIAAIHGLEEDAASGTIALAMEFVDGEDLSRRISRGPIPIDEAVAIAKQIAEAFEEAHERGVIHRDLKPANVKVTSEGKVKVLDFGLAKAIEGEAGTTSGSNDVSHSPTMTKQGTVAGMILGTAAYMSPEQARGKKVDKRADIWSFGVVVYEMLTGRRLFDGETVSDVLAAVLTRTPDWQSLPNGVPAGVVGLLRRCIERDPKKRLHDIADARIALEDAEASGDARFVGATAGPRAGTNGAASWASRAAFVAVGLAIGWGATAFLSASRNEAPASGILRYEIAMPPGHSFLGDVALSPNRRFVAFSASNDVTGTRALWLRPLDALESRVIDGSDDGRFPFWSPDSRELGYFGSGELRAFDTVSGANRPITRGGAYTEVRGASWGSSGVIVFNPRYSGGLLKVSAQGGAVEPASRLDISRGEGTHRMPTFLSDGKHFTFYASPGAGMEPGEVCLGELGSVEHRCLGAASSSGVPVPSGHLLFVRGKTLLAQRIDVAAGRLTGEPAPLGPEFQSNVGTSGQRAFSVGGDALAYHLGAASQNRLVWVDRSGKELEAVYDRPQDWIFFPRLSPDGRRIALTIYRQNATGGVWVLDPARSGETPLAVQGDNQSGEWSASGREVVILNFGLDGEGSVLRADPDRPQSARLWKKVPGLSNVDSWGPGDRSVFIAVIHPETRTDIWELTEAGELRPILVTPASEHSPEMSPDGRWLAYVSDVGGREDVYVQAISGMGNPWKVSTSGGNDPRWRPDGRELFFVSGGRRLFASATTLGASFEASVPEPQFSAAFDLSGNRAFDVARDGRRFLVNVSRGSSKSSMVLLIGLQEEIRSREAAASRTP